MPRSTAGVTRTALPDTETGQLSRGTWHPGGAGCTREPAARPGFTAALPSRGFLLAVDRIAWDRAPSTSNGSSSRGDVRGRTWGTGDTAPTDGTITMDLRFAAFELITRDAELRALLVNYADRVEHGRAPDGTAPETCFLALKWSDNDRPDAPAGSQLLTARAHMPRHRPNERLFLDLVLGRLRAILAVDTAKRLITARCLGTSREIMDDAGDTIFKTSTFEVAPARPQRTGEALLELAPWTGCVHLGTTCYIAPSSAVPSLN
jgi:hypothetical protein